MILFVVLLIASIAGIHMVHRITKPLRGLTEAAKQVAGGDWNAKIEAGGQDEVGVLATALAGKILGSKLESDDVQSTMIDQMIADLDSDKK